MADEKLQEQIRDFQVTQQQLQIITGQKLQTNIQLKETERALDELRLSKADTDVYKAVGRILVKSDAEALRKELEDEKETISVRLKSLEKQEQKLKSKIEELQKTLESKLKAQ